MSCSKYVDLMHEVQDLLEDIPEEEIPVAQDAADTVDPEEAAATDDEKT